MQSQGQVYTDKSEQKISVNLDEETNIPKLQIISEVWQNYNELHFYCDLGPTYMLTLLLSVFSIEEIRIVFANLDDYKAGDILEDRNVTLYYHFILILIFQ